jgi:hypothetical protein
MRLIFYFIYSFIFLNTLFLISCVSDSISDVEVEKKDHLQFELLSPEETGIFFNNYLNIDELKSPFENINVYNGGGVAIGDINNDGLPDIYFTGNQVGNRLFLNKGNFQFEDITESAGVGVEEGWSTGVTMYDVNGNGFLDIYVCRAYHDDPKLRENLLFINNGDLTFTEMAADYGLNDDGYSIVATFLDYNKDGHADLFVGNHPTGRMRSFGEHIQNFHNPSLETSDRLYKNNGDGTFSDVTVESGILNYGWTLGVIAADLNQDGWTDLFVAVDHTEPDRYYLNNGDGTFREVSDEKLMHMSHSSMGIDAADINNNGLLDLAVVEMLSTDNFNEKTKMASMNPDLFWTFVDNDYHFQYMRNMLHLNVGGGHFVEIGQMAGVHRTNWSWAALLADFDNDGWKDFFVTNGYFREYLDKDHFNRIMGEMERSGTHGRNVQELMLDFGRLAPSTKTKNNFFRNLGDYKFNEVSGLTGLDFKGFSSGAAYADLNGNGKLDLVINNINDNASIYRNNLKEGNNYLRIKLNHPPNVCPIGTKVRIDNSTGLQFQEFTTTRGYQSAVEGIIHFGLGKEEKVDRLLIQWLDGRQQEITNIAANQLLEISYENSSQLGLEIHERYNPFFFDVTTRTGIDFVHQEMIYDDYQKQVLLPHKMSQLGPFIATADINGNGLEDFFIGGGNGQPGTIFLQTADGKFEKADMPSFMVDMLVDDMGAVFIDVNNDGLVDLYVASGGNEYPEGSELYRDRLYINLGNGVLQKVTNALPDIRISSSCVVPYDFNKDGFIDLFVGGRHVPWKYPSPANSVLLENDNGFYQDVTRSKAPDLIELGMVTDAVWLDFDGDGQTELIIVGEWMPISVFKWEDGQLKNKTSSFQLDNTVGWWNRIVAADLNGNGLQDLIIGNLGTNYKYAASEEKPFHVFADDFDGDGLFDIVLGYYFDDNVLYPVRGRECSSEQLPFIASQFTTYEEYGMASLFDIYGPKLNSALHYEATLFESVILYNRGNGKYDIVPLPVEAQFSPVNGIVVQDIDGDGKKDILLGGNLFVSEVETGRADASKGCFLRNLGNEQFKAYLPYESGLWLPLDLKDIQPLKIGPNGRTKWLISNNNDQMQVIEYLKD